MSIPSIRFRPPPRRISMQRSGPIYSGVNNNRPSNPALASFNLSSSDDSSDDLPMIQSNTKNQMQDIPLDSSSLDEVVGIDQINDNDDTKNQVNWASKNAKPQDVVSQKNKNLNSPSNSDSQPTHTSQQEHQSNTPRSSHSSEEQVNSPSDSGKVPQRKRKRVRKYRVPQQAEHQQQNSNIIQDNQRTCNMPDSDKENEVNRDRSHQSEVHSKAQNHFSNSGNISLNEQNNPQLSRTNPQIRTNITTKIVDIANYPQNSFNQQRSATLNRRDMLNTAQTENQSNKIETFAVVKETKHSRKNNADFRMMKNENAVYFARATKDDIGIFYNISKTVPIVHDSPDIVGILRKQNHGKRYTVYGMSEKLNDDRDPELLGMAFVKNPDYKSKQKTFRIAFRKGGHINYPISKRRELSRVAEDLQLNFPEIDTLFNKPPIIGPDGNPVSNFGKMFVVDSSKNYVINDENDQTIFMIFKSSEASYTVKTKSPFNSLMAFGLSIAIIEDCR